MCRFMRSEACPDGFETGGMVRRAGLFVSYQRRRRRELLPSGAAFRLGVAAHDLVDQGLELRRHGVPDADDAEERRQRERRNEAAGVSQLHAAVRLRKIVAAAHLAEAAADRV